MPILCPQYVGWDSTSLSMRGSSFGDLCRDIEIHADSPSDPITMHRRRISASGTDCSPHSPSSFIGKLKDPPLIPFYKPLDYVEALAQIYAAIENAPNCEKPSLYLQQSFVFRGLDEIKLTRRSIRAARQYSASIQEKIVYTAWLKYEKRDEEMNDSSAPKCNGHVLECPRAALLLEPSLPVVCDACPCKSFLAEKKSDHLWGCNSFVEDDVLFLIGDRKVACHRKSLAALSAPFQAMLFGSFCESRTMEIDFSGNGISASSMAVIGEFSKTGLLGQRSSAVLLELLTFSNRFCCDSLKLACEKGLQVLVSSLQDAIVFMEFALEENAPLLMSTCIQVMLWELPHSLHNAYVADLFCSKEGRKKLMLLGHSSYALYALLVHVAMDEKLSGDISLPLLEGLEESTTTRWQRSFALHLMGCMMFADGQYRQSQRYFELAVEQGHVYSMAGVARSKSRRGHSISAYKDISGLLSSLRPAGWMYQERALYSEGEEKMEDLSSATELDPTLVFPYKYRTAVLMDAGKMHEAMSEINLLLGFKVTPDCLEMHAHISLDLEDYEGALRDIRAIHTLDPEYMLYSGKVSAQQLLCLLNEHVEKWSRADCWMQLYDRWSSVDDIGSLAVVHQMLDSEPGKGLLYFRQSLLLLRLNCPRIAMRSLALARRHASSEQERLVYEGWIFYDTGRRDEALEKAEASIAIQRSFEAFFLKAYALADTSLDSESAVKVIELLEEALKCPSDGLRKGQALNNLGSVYVDCGKLDLAEDCYTSALKIRHTRAHQGLARVHFLKNDRKAAYDEMTKLIEKARNNASAYEKRSEYCDRNMAKADLNKATQLDPLRTYPYRYRAAVLMDDQKEEAAIAELSKAISFKLDLQLLHLRAAFYDSIGDFTSSLRDCRASLSIDPTHVETLHLYTRVSHQRQKSSLMNVSSRSGC